MIGEVYWFRKCLFHTWTASSSIQQHEYIQCCVSEMLCKHYQNGNLIPHISRCSKVIILLSYRINLFSFLKFVFFNHAWKFLFFPLFFIDVIRFGSKREISYLNWNVNKLDIEGDIFGWPWNELLLFHLIS